MKRLCFFSIIGGVALLVADGQLQAADKTGVCVRFILKESAYRDQFGATPQPTSKLLELEEVQAGAAACIRYHLSDEAGFLNYTTEAPQDYTLTFTLDCADPQATGPMKEVGLHVKLTGPGTLAPIVHEPVYERVRLGTAYTDRIGNIEDVLKEIDVAIKKKTLLDNIKNYILCKVPVSNGGKLSLEPFGWMIPVTPQELKLAMKSQFRIVNKYPARYNPNRTRDYYGYASYVITSVDSELLRPYLNKLFCEPRKDQDYLKELEAAAREGTATIVNVFIVKYHCLDMETERATHPHAVKF